MGAISDKRLLTTTPVKWLDFKSAIAVLRQMHRLTLESAPPEGTILPEPVRDANARNLQERLTTARSQRSAGTLSYSLEIIPKDDFDGDISQLVPQPIFCSLPWISDHNLQYATFYETPSLRMTAKLLPQCTVVNHLSCYNITEQQVDNFLATGMRNLFIIRGDTVNPEQRFQHASDLVQYIKEKHTDATVGVGGYTYTHPESTNVADDIRYLQQKVSAGADFVLTQTLYETASFRQFMDRCRAAGIQVPIIPGIFLPQSYRQFKVILHITQVALPASVRATFEAHAHDTEDEFEAFVVDYFVGVIRELSDVPLIHFFTFNKLDLLQRVLSSVSDLMADK